MAESETQARDLVEKTILSLVPQEFREAPEIKFAAARLSALAEAGMKKALFQLQLDNATLQEATLLAAELQSEELSPAPREVASTIATRHDQYSAAFTLIAHHQPVPPWFKLEHDCSECGQKSNPVWTTYCLRLDFDTVSIEEALKHVLCESCGTRTRQRLTPKIVKFESWFLLMAILRLKKEGPKDLYSKALRLAKQSLKKNNPSQPEPRQPTAPAPQPLRTSIATRIKNRGEEKKEKKKKDSGSPQVTPPPPEGDGILEIHPDDAEIVIEDEAPAATPPPIPVSPPTDEKPVQGEDPKPIRIKGERNVNFNQRLRAWEARQPKTTG